MFHILLLLIQCIKNNSFCNIRFITEDKLKAIG